MIRKILRWIAIVLLAAVVLLIVAPLVLTAPQPRGTRDPQELGDADSRFVEVDGVRLHYKQYGSGQPVMILLHGFAASTFSFRQVVEPLAQLGTVIVYDRPGQGLTERPRVTFSAAENPYSLDDQPRLLIGLMDALGIHRAILMGNSAGGTVAALAAQQYPQRVQALVLIDAAIYRSGPSYSEFVRRLLFTPQAEFYGRLLLRSFATRGLELLNTAWHDPSRIPPDAVPGYTQALGANDWDRGLLELTRAPRTQNPAAGLASMDLPVLVLTGDDDRIVPTELSLQLAKDIPGAQLAVMQACGHTPQEECPDQFLQAVTAFVKGL